MIVALYPEDCSESLVDGLRFSEVTPAPMKDLVPEDPALVDAATLVVELGPQPMRRLREVGRIIEVVGLPVMLVTARDQLALLGSEAGISDFILSPVDPVEFRLRMLRLDTENSAQEILRFKDLELNPLNYQAALAGEPIDLTFMEYELLRFLVENPVRVWSREQLLSKVWGYEYYGGARTVDVHVRRLRSKLGEERSSWITTVRSVGYRFG